MTSGGEVVSSHASRRAWLRAWAVGLVLATLAFFSTGPARQTFDAMLRIVFPHRVTMQVAPGNVRVKVGSPLGINARVVGGRAQTVAQVEMGDGDHWRTVDMTTDKDGRFRLRLDTITSSFKYRVLAGTVTSPTYTVVAAYPPRVTSIAVDYSYPESLGLKPRHQEGRGDIDAPPGTNVQLHVYVDRPTAAGVLALANGERIALSSVSAAELSGMLMVAGDNAYRVMLAGADGVRSDGDAEYLIRARSDRALNLGGVIESPASRPRP